MLGDNAARFVLDMFRGAHKLPHLVLREPVERLQLVFAFNDVEKSKLLCRRYDAIGTSAKKYERLSIASNDSHVGVVGLICRGLVQRLVRPSPRVRRLQRLLEKLVLRLRHGGVGGALHDATRRQTPSVYRRALRP